jgi:hypothetical protein
VTDDRAGLDKQGQLPPGIGQPSDAEMMVGMREALECAVRTLQTGEILSPYVAPTAMVMIGLILLDSTMPRGAVKQWLKELAASYSDGNGEA